MHRLKKKIAFQERKELLLATMVEKKIRDKEKTENEGKEDFRPPPMIKSFFSVSKQLSPL